MNGIHGLKAVRIGSIGDDITDWVLVTDGQETFLGKPVDNPGSPEVMRLEPAYSVLTGWTGGNNAITRQRLIVPLELLPSARSIDVLHPVRVLRLASLDASDREGFKKGIEGAEKTRSQLQGQRAGLILDAPMPPPTRR